MYRLADDNRVVFVEPQRNPDISYLSDLGRSWRYFGKRYWILPVDVGNWPDRSSLKRDSEI